MIRTAIVFATFLAATNALATISKDVLSGPSTAVNASNSRIAGDLLPIRRIGCCNGKTYPLFSALCCDDVLYQNDGSDPKFSSRLCCGKKTYLSPKQLCCNNKIVKNPYPINGGCCNGRPFDGYRKICCEGNLYSISRDSSTYCCGSKAFDFDEARCVNGKIVWLDGEGGNNPGICGRRVFNADRQLCCQGQIFNKKNRYSVCCDNAPRIYNGLNEICCNGAVSPKPKTSSYTCCGTRPYDYNTELCCGDGKSATVIPKPPTDPNVYTYYQCCNGEAFDASNKFCCGDEVYSWEGSLSCCGSHSYNYSTSFCCGTRVYQNDKVASKTSCCNDKYIYDPNKNFCCQDRLIPRPPGAQCSPKCFGPFPPIHPGGPIAS